MSNQIEDLKKLMHDMRTADVELPRLKGDLITYESAKLLPVLELIKMNEKISFLILPSANDRVIIWNKFLPNCKINAHYHNCWELAMVLEGSVWYQGREYLRGEVLIIKAFLEHVVEIGKNGGVLIVQLLDPAVHKI